MTYLIYY